MVPITDARQFVFDACRAIDPIEMPLERAIGCIVASDVVASGDVPPFANSAVDGYAVVARDTSSVPVDLAVVGEIAAGAPPTPTVGPGEAVRIMTGAPIPSGADAVVMVEDTDLLGARELLDGSVRVRVGRAVSSGDAVREAGSDVQAGQTVLAAGSEITPAVAGVLASVNARHVRAHRRPRVAVLSTGDELIDDGSELAPGQIRESNKTMLLGLVAAAGCEPVDHGIVRDDPTALEAVLRDAAASCDAIVTSGGVSMGDYDVVKEVLSRIASMRWMQIAIKPAKPFAFGLLDGVPIFGLPGNPVSSLVSFELLARPALRRMAGHGDTADRTRVTAVADVELRRKPDGKVHYQRVLAQFSSDGRVHVRPSGGQGSHQLAASAQANGLAELPDGPSIAAGADVEVLLLGVPPRN